MKGISKAEEMVLLAVWRLGDEANGVTIRRQILKSAGKNYTYGTLYGLLRQMDRKGYLRRAKAEPLPKRGGRAKSYFKITPSGTRALKEAIELHQLVWKNIDALSLGKP
ncbi:MAG: PadR family transcriptional regulator [Candidatus Aminicenantes bacterium]|nr:PadR family transcriptional regulator [Candidatus Aminicenantes bacterium]